MRTSDRKEATGVLIAPTFDELIRASTPSSARQRALQTMRSYWTAVWGKDADALRALHSDDIVLELPFSESGRVEEGAFRSFRGVDAVMEFWAAAWMMEGEGAGLFDAEVTVSDDGRVVFIEAFGQITMTNGRDYRNRYVIRATIEDALVTSYREYYNPIVAARAFGRVIANEGRRA